MNNIYIICTFFYPFLFSIIMKNGLLIVQQATSNYLLTPTNVSVQEKMEL